MESLLAFTRSLGPIVRPLVFIMLGVYLISKPTLINGGSIPLYGVFVVPQQGLAIVFLVLGVLDFAKSIIALFRGDFSSIFSGVYRAYFSYNQTSLIESVQHVGHPPDWSEQEVICPIASGMEDWRASFERQMAYVDKIIDPHNELYLTGENLKTDLILCLSGRKVDKHKQAYVIEGFGYILDETVTGTSKSKYVSLVIVDPRYSHNFFSLNGPIDLIRFFIFGKKILLCCEQSISVQHGSANSTIRFYIYCRIKVSSKHGMWVDGPALVYLDDPEQGCKAVNAHCELANQ